MLDETTYFLTFTWDDETQRVILRDETARSDRNTLTMDDADSGHEKIDLQLDVDVNNDRLVMLHINPNLSRN